MGGEAVEAGRGDPQPGGHSHLRIPRYGRPRLHAHVAVDLQPSRALRDARLAGRQRARDQCRERAEAIIAAVRRQGRTVLTEPESKQLLAAYGIPTVKTVIAQTARRGRRRRGRIGYPIVLKLYSETITHKTDVGGVQLNLSTPTPCARPSAPSRRRSPACRRRTFPGRQRPAHDQPGRL